MRHIATPTGKVKTLRFSPDGRRLWFLSNDPTQHFGRFHKAHSIDIWSGSLVANVELDKSQQYATNVAVFSPDLLSVYRDCGGDYTTDLRHVDLVTGQERLLLQADLLFVNCLAITPNEHLLAIGGDETSEAGMFWSIRRLDVIHGTLLEPIRTIATCLAYSPSGQLLAVGGQLRAEFRDEGLSSGIRILSGKRIVEEFDESACHLAWSPDGRLAWGMGRQLNVARPGTKEPVQTWVGSPGELSALSFSVDGRQLLTGMDSGICALHDPAVGQMSATFDWGIGPIHSIAVSPDGLTCAAGGEMGQIVVWDIDM
jgi:WD40 repeat protein